MSEPLKIGLIGSGGIANRHLTAFREHRDRVRLMAVCDIVEDAARDYASRAGVDAVYRDADQMLRDADIEAVDICTTHDIPRVPCFTPAQAHLPARALIGTGVPSYGADR